MQGHFITFEGGEGAGKTTVLKLIEQTLINQGYKVLTTREPGGIAIAEAIREVILNPENTMMDARTEALLYAAARRQHLVEKVYPALKQGKIVLCDRFIDSSLAYQGHARGLGMDEVLSINQFAIDGLMPTLTILFDLKPEDGLKRVLQNATREQNRLDLEDLTFHNLVYEGYQTLLEKFADRIKVVDANQTIEQVESDVLALLKNHLKNHSF